MIPFTTIIFCYGKIMVRLRFAKTMHPLTSWKVQQQKTYKLTIGIHGFFSSSHLNKKYLSLFQAAVGSRKTWDQVLLNFTITRLDFFQISPKFLEFGETSCLMTLRVSNLIQLWRIWRAIDWSAFLVQWLNLMNRKLQNWVQFENGLHCKTYIVELKLLIGF